MARTKKRADLSTNRESDKIIVRLPAGMREMLKRLAEENGRSMSSEVAFALTRHFAEWRVGPMSEDLNDRILERMKAPDVPDPKVMHKIAQYIEEVAKALDPVYQGDLKQFRQERLKKGEGREE
jgi:Arc-like DNA binding domain